MPLKNHPTDPEKYIYKPQEYNLSQLSGPSTITFHKPLSGSWLMRITAEGRIEVAEGADVTETAQKVLDAMEGMLDDRIKKAALDEREACAAILDANAMACQSPIMRSLLQSNAQAIRVRGQA